MAQSTAQIDPFYPKMLEKAERELARRDYVRAAKDLEIAAFGLAQDRKMLAKAYVYLGICHFQLKNITQSEEYLRQAAELMAEESIDSLNILESARPELDRLLVFYNIQNIQVARGAGSGVAPELAGARAGETGEKAADLKENPGAAQKMQPATPPK
ncbi:MAG: hypothetical protein QHH14_11905, partial [Clostridiales bacterium]|nr:hypothetical protein [Clostridiales bacterium]